MSINVCNDRSMASITSLPSGVSGSSLVLISEQTASSSSTISFTSGIDSTYKEYIFKFIDIHPSADGEDLEFNMSADTGSNYNVTKTTTLFDIVHNEDGSNPDVAYSGGRDLAQGTGFQDLMGGIGNDNDQSGSGYLHLFNPSSTTFVKHFIAQTQMNSATNYSVGGNTAGYFNTTSAITAIQFKMSSGNIDAGDICLYGIL